MVPEIERAPPLWAWSKHGIATLTAKILTRLKDMAEKIIDADTNFEGRTGK
jgi:hypothetical protein